MELLWTVERAALAAGVLVALAAMWSARWRPWRAWRVRYVPVMGRGWGGSLAEVDNLVCEVVTLTPPEDVWEQLRGKPGLAVVREVDGSGKCGDKLIGGVVDATPLVFEQTTTAEPLAFHRYWQAGGYWVNLPPEEVLAVVGAEGEPLAPEPGPREVESWREMAMRRLGNEPGVPNWLLERARGVDPEAVAWSGPVWLLEEQGWGAG
jgi:hypothetical protein